MGFFFNYRNIINIPFMVIVIYINKVFQNGGQNGKKIKAELLN